MPFRCPTVLCRKSAGFVRGLLVLISLCLSPASWCACHEECSMPHCAFQGEDCPDHAGFGVHIRQPNCCNEDDCPVPHSSQERVPSSNLTEGYVALLKSTLKSFQYAVPSVGQFDWQNSSTALRELCCAGHFFDGFAPQLAVPLRFCVMNS